MLIPGQNTSNTDAKTNLTLYVNIDFYALFIKMKQNVVIWTSGNILVVVITSENEFRMGRMIYKFWFKHMPDLDEKPAWFTQNARFSSDSGADDIFNFRRRVGR